MKRYSFTILLGLSLAVAASVKGGMYVTTWAQAAHRPVLIEAPASSAPVKIEITVSPKTETTVETVAETAEETTGEIVEETAVFTTADRSYFSDALFIGDSRTLGLYEYGDLGEADVFANTGMTVFEVFDASISVKSVGKTTLEELLNTKEYGKIYIMLGLNEMGYSYDSIVKQYQSLADTVRRLQPEAVIFLQANLHVTQKKSQTNPTYSNEKIDQLNAAIEEMGENREKTYYLDVNPLFDDGAGNLSEDYTADSAHVLGKYYADWVDWILTKAVE